MNIGGGELKELKPRILVMGIGGAGGNAINSRIESGMQGVEFVAVNTDAQDLRVNKAEAKIAGITPAELIFNGKCDESPPYILFPICLFG